MKITSDQIKQTALSLGADLCGIASAEVFDGAPRGHHPKELLPGCKSVIVIACRFPQELLDVKTIQYTDARDTMTIRMNQMAAELGSEISNLRYLTRNIDSMGHSQWEADGRFRDVLSLKHAAMLAGLGRFGKNSLLINDKFGNMIWISAVLTNAYLNPDSLAEYEVCPAGCKRCINSCPVQALGEPAIKQRTCYDHAYMLVTGRADGKEGIIRCNTCRVVCPNAFGIHHQAKIILPAAVDSIF